jgi:glutamate N-acetyltransferase/amino-acid N-acetyltransferase
MMKTSPLAPKTNTKLPPVNGVRLAAVEAGINYAGRKDLSVMVFDGPAEVAGVFTRSKCASAPVDWSRKCLVGGTARAMVVNAGNANAFTGMKGVLAVKTTANAAAKALDCSADQIFLASTGVIGEPLDATKFSHLLDGLFSIATRGNWAEMASAIMTTDTFAKTSTRSVEIDGKSFNINGIAKGSGMIAPDMATMLSFIVTDAPVSSSCLQFILSAHVDETYNAITVDSDTSTSDTVLVFSTGAGGAIAPIEDRNDPRLPDFSRMLVEVMHDLALLIVRDGEGAQKLIEISVTGARTNGAAKKIAMSIANSPLVKTAIAGEDANWGRIVMAVGKAGEDADRDRLAIWFGKTRVAVDGERDPDYSEEAASEAMKNSEVSITVDLGLDQGHATVWTCDLTHGYIEINADYRS